MGTVPDAKQQALAGHLAVGNGTRPLAFSLATDFAAIGDREAAEILRFKHGRLTFSLRRSERLGNLNVWLPANISDVFIGAIERADSRLPVARACRIGDWSKDDTDSILRAALAAYDSSSQAGGGQ